MSKPHLLPLTLLALSCGAFAADAPSAGGQLRQIPPTTAPPGVIPALNVKPAPVAALLAADTVRIVVNALTITGAQAFPEATLLASTGFRPGSEMSLTELRGIAQAITQHYRRNGYFVAQAYLPAQDIKNGTVTIAVLEGRYDKITVNNRSGVSDSLVGDLLGGLDRGDPVLMEPLDERLLLLSDLPGVRVSSTLQPGISLGTSDLVVDLQPGPSVSGSVDADNAGNRYTGTNRVGATLNFNEPLGLGDVASLRVLTSGAGLKYARAAYQLQFGKAKLGVAYSHLDYALGEEFAALQAKGSAQVASLYGSYPLLRSRNANVSAGLALDAKRFQDRSESTGSVSDKQAQVLTASVYGDHRDTLGGGGFTNYSLGWSVGHIDLQTPYVQLHDADTARTHGDFSKLSASVGRVQRLSDAVSLSATLSGQLASVNLDVSEKMELGGMYGVRAYPEGEAYADEGVLLNLEARLLLPAMSDKLPGRMQLIGFVDAGSVTINKNPWPGSGRNQRTLSGAGIGFNWSEPNNFLLRAYYAVKLGDEAPTSAPDQDGRFWIQAVKYF